MTFKKCVQIVTTVVLVSTLATVFRLSLRNAVPKRFETIPDAPKIYPDYVETTIPPNIAPINFYIEDDASAYVTVVTGEKNGAEIVVAGREVRLPEKKWRALIRENAGSALRFQVYEKTRADRTWRAAAPFAVDVSEDPIDSWLAYRLLAPGYDYGGWISLEERCLESYETRSLFDNRATGACVNCHAFQNRRTEKYSIHYRPGRGLPNGGTMIALNGNYKKITGKIDEINGRCSYPAWRPTGDLIACSSNKTFQALHSMSTQKIEVVDSESDLVLIDAATNRATVVTKTLDEFETFPQWSPDGSELYYCCAKVKLEVGLDRPTDRAEELAANVSELRYNVYKREFNEETREFGEPVLVVDARAKERSALHPRVSPNGRFLVYVLVESGVFPLWRPEADLWIKDLTTGEERPLAAANDRNAESYHTWDSSGKWLVFSSRREDGQYARPYFTHVDENGTATKAFVLPQRDPLANKKNFRAYNVPELLVEPVRDSKKRVYEAITSKPQGMRREKK